MNRVLFPAILALALGLHAQTPPDAAELTKLLKDFLAGASKMTGLAGHVERACAKVLRGSLPSGSPQP